MYEDAVVQLAVSHLEEVLSVVIPLLRSNNINDKKHAINCLKGIGCMDITRSADVVQLLIRALEDHEVRSNAAIALCNIGTPEAIAAQAKSK